MMKNITTREMLHEYILSKLGAPVIDVEVTKDQINYCIDDAIKEFTEVADDGNETEILVLELKDNVKEYVIDGRIKSIKNLSISSSTGINNIILGGGIFLTPTELFANSVTMGALSTGVSNTLSNLTVALSNVSMYNTLFKVQVRYDFNEYTKRLKFFEPVYKKADRVLLECYLNYFPQEVDYIYDNVWVKAYATALVKLTWGNNVGKYDATLIGGAKINFGRLIDEANHEIEELKKELYSKWVAPLGVYRI